MLDTLIGLIAFIFVLGVIIIVHEGGHFLFARKANILCREYAFGMGPLLFSKKKGETLYSIRAFPIGGFCAIAGEEVEDDPLKDAKTVKLEIVDGVVVGFYFDTDKIKFDKPEYEFGDYDIFDAEETGNLFIDIKENDVVTRCKVDPQAMMYMGKIEMQIAPYNRTIGSKSKIARTLVIAGGPFFNFLLALVVFFIAGLSAPNVKSNVIGEMDESLQQMPAYVAGLREDDKVISLSSAELGYKDITAYSDLQKYMDEYEKSGYAGQITLGYERDGVKETITVMPAIAINNAAFGSDLIYKLGDEVIVGAYAEAKSNLIDNSELKKGDIIKEISWYDGDLNKQTKTVTSWADVYPVFQQYVGGYDNQEHNYVYMKVLRDNEGNLEPKDIKITPYTAELMDSQSSLLGDKISLVDVQIGVTATYHFSIVNGFKTAGKGTASSFLAVFKTLKMLFTGGANVSNLSGPVGIFSMTKEVAKYGFLNILALIGMLSVNVGLLNLFPIPALDGGRLVFIAYEAITGKKPNPKVETILITVTMLLLFALIIFVTFGDVLRLIGL